MTCGVDGMRRRTRTCLGDFPGLCPEEDFNDDGMCETLPDCPRWRDWSMWGDCSKSCDDGIKRRMRTCRAAHLETCDNGKKSSETFIEDKNISVSIQVNIY